MNIDRAGNQNYFVASFNCRLGNRVAHFSGRTIA
jgi:hypothetical protein